MLIHNDLVGDQTKLTLKDIKANQEAIRLNANMIGSGLQSQDPKPSYRSTSHRKQTQSSYNTTDVLSSNL